VDANEIDCHASDDLANDPVQEVLQKGDWNGAGTTESTMARMIVRSKITDAGPNLRRLGSFAFSKR
jgi:hypothetical protein